MALLNRSWYVIGLCETHRQVRTFNLDRIISVAVLEETFSKPSKFSLESYLGNAWMMIPEGKTYAVRLRFNAKVAGNVEEVIWHKTQCTQRQPDGSLIFEATIDGLTEIGWWIMGYGDQVYVEKPIELRERVAHVAEMVLSQYKK